MKKVIFILASLTALMFVGCGEGGESISADTVSSVANASSTEVKDFPAVPQIPAD